ncbi:MAG: M20 family metallopeptidase [Fidelibacterota bacterium]
MNKLQIHEEVKAIEKDIIATRRLLHQQPELGFLERETAGLITRRLEDLGLEVTTGLGKTGVSGLLLGGSDGPCIALRADMDGLPIQETGDLSFRSQNDGVMHACGHDGHMAMLLGAAQVLSSRREQLQGSVKFIFQPAEEGGAGARFMIEEGVLEHPRVDEIYGIHLWNYQPYGTVGVKEGAILAAADEFTILVKGRGGHGALPHTAVDAVVVAAQLVTALQTIPSRNINPLESSVVTVGKITGGDNFNIIADKVALYGTVRSYKEENRQTIMRRMKEITNGIAATFGAEIELVYKEGYPLTVNHADSVAKVQAVARKIVGDGVQFPYLSMGGEDFSFYLQEIPGCFFFVGSAPPNREPLTVPHHCSYFDIDERALLVGCSIWVELVTGLLK